MTSRQFLALIVKAALGRLTSLVQAVDERAHVEADHLEALAAELGLPRETEPEVRRRIPLIAESVWRPIVSTVAVALVRAIARGDAVNGAIPMTRATVERARDDLDLASLGARTGLDAADLPTVLAATVEGLSETVRNAREVSFDLEGRKVTFRWVAEAAQRARAGAAAAALRELER